ncbi:unnamed protein product, partial [Mesorhabditis belari]|uniref:LRAT domain-containing protein n=1 Tax=Mesorhabditis belari TaxID=2138241 RepID=A0AAF3FD92_9BILA
MGQMESTQRNGSDENDEYNAEEVTGIFVSAEPTERPQGEKIDCFILSKFMSARELRESGLLRVGDMIVFNRGIYSHYGVYVGKLNGEAMVIHFAGDPEDLASLQNTEIALETLESVSKGKPCRIHNCWDDKNNRYSAKEIVKRAKSKLGPAAYHLLDYNCEHFAMWCRYGIEHSAQVHNVLTVIGSVLPHARTNITALGNVIFGRRNA